MAPAKTAAKKSAAPAKKSASAKKTASAKKPTAAKKPAVAKKPAAAKKTASTKKAAPAKKAAVAKKTAPANKTASAKKAAPAKKKAPAFSEAFLTKQHKALVDERATYERQYRSLRAEAESLVADFESGDVQFDEESGEGDTLNVERERDLALSEQARRAVEEIDHALAKFDHGTYGICEVSGEPIPRERLEAIPWARERVEYKTGALSGGLSGGLTRR
jgi:RNA polymerase-binding transcription factor DksA